jgi:electron transport complex protein RnfE
MGLGFTMALVAVGAIRELLGAGTLTLLFGDRVFIEEPFKFLAEAPGAFITLGLMLGIMNVIGKK